MIGRRVSYSIFLGLCLLCLFQAWYYYPLIPERVASHFGPTGLPDAWSTKSSLIGFYLLVVAGLGAFFSLIRWLMPKIPVVLMNLPNKDYWMSEKRRPKTLDLLSSNFFLFASATMVLLLDVFYQTFQVHLGRANTLSHPFVSLGIYVGITVFLNIALLIKFLRKKG